MKKDSVSEQEKTKYERIWELEGYGDFSPGDLLFYYLETIIQSEGKPGELITDFGCGSAQALQKYFSLELNTQLVDIASNCLCEKAKIMLNLTPDRVRFFQASLWALPHDLQKTQWLTCVDVMEHIPPEKIDPTLASMAALHTGIGFFGIGLHEDKWGKAIEETLHLSVFDDNFWLQKLEKHWKVLTKEVLFEGQYLIVIAKRLAR